MEIVRRRKSEYETQPMRVSNRVEPPRPMKYSQTLSQNNNYIGSPVKGPNNISITISPQKASAPPPFLGQSPPSLTRS